MNIALLFLMFLELIFLCYIAFVVDYQPFIKRKEIRRIEELQDQWERDRKENREKAKDFNKLTK